MATLVTAGLALFTMMPGASAASLVNVSASAPSQEAGAVEAWGFSFTTGTQVNASGDVRIVFPNGFGLDASTVSCDVEAPASVTEETTQVVSSTEVVCALGTNDSIPSGSEVTLRVANVTNPTTNGTYGGFVLQTRDDADAVLDEDTGLVVEIFPDAASSLTQVSASAPDQRTGAITTWRIEFTTAATVPGNGKIWVGFPSGFLTSAGAASACEWETPDVQFGTTVVATQTAVICTVGSDEPIANGTHVVLGVSSVRNPTTEQTTPPFLLQTRAADDSVIEEHASLRTAVVAHPFLVDPEVTVPDPSPGAVNTIHFRFRLFNAWEDDGHLTLHLPSGFTPDAAGPGTTVATFTAGGDGLFTRAESTDGALAFQRTGGTVVYGSTEVRINVTHVTNPTSEFDPTGPFGVTTSDADRRTHDVGSAPGIAIVSGAASTTSTTGGFSTAAGSATTSNATTPTADTTGPPATSTQDTAELLDLDDGGGTPGPGLAAAAAGCLAAAWSWRRRG